MIELHVDAFAANYEVTATLGLHDPESTYRISHARDGKSHLDVLTLRIRPAGRNDWEGEFFRSCGDGLDGAYSTPDQDVLCVVAGGEGYLVNVLRPLEFRMIPFGSVESVFQVSSVPAIVFVGSTDVATYGDADEIWTSERISYDGFQNLQLQGNELRGQAWLAPTDEWYDFKVDLRKKRVHDNRYGVAE